MVKKINLEVGDEFRLNRSKKKCKIINQFIHNGIVYVNYTSGYAMNVVIKDIICKDNTDSGVVEVNGMIVRRGGKILENPKPVSPKPVNPSGESHELTDFEKYLRVQNSGQINMCDVVTGSRLAGISEEKYQKIMHNYSKHYDNYSKK